MRGGSGNHPFPSSHCGCLHPRLTLNPPPGFTLLVGEMRTRGAVDLIPPLVDPRDPEHVRQSHVLTEVVTGVDRTSCRRGWSNDQCGPISACQDPHCTLRRSIDPLQCLPVSA